MLICSGHCRILVRFYPSGEAFGTASDDATVSNTDSTTINSSNYMTVDLSQWLMAGSEVSHVWHKLTVLSMGHHCLTFQDDLKTWKIHRFIKIKNLQYRETWSRVWSIWCNTLHFISAVSFVWFKSRSWTCSILERTHNFWSSISGLFIQWWVSCLIFKNAEKSWFVILWKFRII